MAMLKCRFPYVDNTVSISHLTYDINDIQDKVIISDTNNSDDIIDDKYKMLYLDGELFIQISPNSFSTETHLISRRDPNVKYLLKNYDIKKYESQCFYFNSIDRIKQYKYKDSDQLKHHLMGFNDSYDCVAEFFICSKYLKYHLHEEYDFEKIVKMLYDIHYYLNEITRRNIIGCEIRTLNDDYIKKNPNRYKNKYITKYIKNNRVDELERKLLKYQNDKLHQINSQIRFMKQGHILTKEQYHKQIKSLYKAKKYIIHEVRDVLRHLNSR